MEYNWILIRQSNDEYISWSNEEKKPKTHDDKMLRWEKWNKELPPDIDNEGVVYHYDKKTKDLVKQ